MSLEHCCTEAVRLSVSSLESSITLAPHTRSSTSLCSLASVSTFWVSPRPWSSGTQSTTAARSPLSRCAPCFDSDLSIPHSHCDLFSCFLQKALYFPHNPIDPRLFFFLLICTTTTTFFASRNCRHSHGPFIIRLFQFCFFLCCRCRSLLLLFLLALFLMQS